MGLTITSASNSGLQQNIGHGMVICLTEKDIPLSRDVDAAPVGYL